MADTITVLDANELILDKVRFLTAHDIGTGEMLFRLTSLEDPSLQTGAEGEELTDSVGALITTLYRAKTATFSATNSLLSLDLAAQQFGTKREKASSTNVIAVPTYEILTANGVEGTPVEIELKHKVSNNVKYVYALVDNNIGTSYEVAASKEAIGEKEFFIDSTGDVSKLTLPTGTTGKIYIEYEYETADAATRVINKTSEFPEACSVKIYVLFRDKCNENTVYSGVIVANRAKLNPESVELALTSTGKHPFEMKMMREYCDDEAELFSIIVAQ